MAVNIFKKAAEYRKKHPRTSFQDAIQKVKRGKVSGTKKKAVGAVKRKPAAKKKAPVKNTRVSVRVGKVGRVGAVSKGMAILSDINKLEAMRKRSKSRDIKDIIQIDINALHDRLDMLKRKRG